MKRAVVTLLLAALIAAPIPAFAQNKPEPTLPEKAKAAVALLYSQDESGGMSMHCTMTAFEKTKDGYLFATAAHCIGSDDTQHEKSAPHANISFFMTFDETGAKTFYPAEVKAVGYQHRGDDFAIFEVKSDKEWPVIPVGTEKLEADGNAVLNVASPLGLGKQVYRGVIASLDVDRPIIQGDINWRHSISLQIAADGGSSGSAIISEKQEAIVAFLVGTVGGAVVIAIPASKFTVFKAAVGEKKYKWYDSEQ